MLIESKTIYIYIYTIFIIFENFFIWYTKYKIYFRIFPLLSSLKFKKKKKEKAQVIFLAPKRKKGERKKISLFLPYFPPHTFSAGSRVHTACGSINKDSLNLLRTWKTSEKLLRNSEQRIKTFGNVSRDATS